MLKVKGRNTSGNVMKVTWILEELGIPYQQEDVGGKFGKNKEKEYLDLNPMGLVPTLIDDDIVLWESNTIVRYLAKKYSFDAMSPSDDGMRAKLELWMDWQSAQSHLFSLRIVLSGGLVIDQPPQALKLG